MGDARLASPNAVWVSFGNDVRRHNEENFFTPYLLTAGVASGVFTMFLTEIREHAQNRVSPAFTAAFVAALLAALLVTVGTSVPSAPRTPALCGVSEPRQRRTTGARAGSGSGLPPIRS